MDPKPNNPLQTLEIIQHELKNIQLTDHQHSLFESSLKTIKTQLIRLQNQNSLLHHKLKSADQSDHRFLISQLQEFQDVKQELQSKHDQIQSLEKVVHDYEQQIQDGIEQNRKRHQDYEQTVADCVRLKVELEQKTDIIRGQQGLANELIKQIEDTGIKDTIEQKDSIQKELETIKLELQLKDSRYTQQLKKIEMNRQIDTQSSSHLFPLYLFVMLQAWKSQKIDLDNIEYQDLNSDNLLSLSSLSEQQKLIQIMNDCSQLIEDVVFKQIQSIKNQLLDDKGFREYLDRTLGDHLGTKELLKLIR